MNSRPRLRLVGTTARSLGAGSRGELPSQAAVAEDAEAPATTPPPAESVAREAQRPDGPSLSEMDDDLLVGLVVQGQRAAAEMLYRRHAAFAFNLAARIAGSTTDMEDVVHDAFLKAYDHVAGLRNPKAFRTWLGSIVVHAVRSRLRRAKFVRLCGLGRGTDPVDIECIASDEASPGERAELAQIYALLRTLSANDRIAWTLRFVEGHDLKDAAALAGCSLATIKRRILRTQRYIEAHYVGTTLLDSSTSLSDDAPSLRTEGRAETDADILAGTDEQLDDEGPRSGAAPKARGTPAAGSGGTRAPGSLGVVAARPRKVSTP